MDNKQKNKNSAAKIKANNKWIQTNYKRMQISTTPEQADYIRETAKKYDITIVQLIIDSIKLFEENAERLPAGAATPSGTADTAQPEQPENVTTESPMESEETAGAQPEQDTAAREEEEPQEDEIETEETTEEENQTAGEEEPEEDEDIPEELKAVRAAWARMGAFNEKITAERKRREAEERERRREITDEERYMMR